MSTRPPNKAEVLYSEGFFTSAVRIVSVEGPSMDAHNKQSYAPAARFPDARQTCADFQDSMFRKEPLDEAYGVRSAPCESQWVR